MHFEYDLVPKRRKRKKQRPPFNYGNSRNSSDICMMQDQSDNCCNIKGIDDQPENCCHIKDIDDQPENCCHIKDIDDQPDNCCHIKDIDDQCKKDCLCGQLQNLARGTIVIISTTGLNINDLMAARFINYDKKTRCATFRVLTLDLILRCRDIKAIIL